MGRLSQFLKISSSIAELAAGISRTVAGSTPARNCGLERKKTQLPSQSVPPHRDCTLCLYTQGLHSLSLLFSLSHCHTLCLYTQGLHTPCMYRPIWPETQGLYTHRMHMLHFASPIKALASRRLSALYVRTPHTPGSTCSEVRKRQGSTC